MGTTAPALPRARSHGPQRPGGASGPEEPAEDEATLRALRSAAAEHGPGRGGVLCLVPGRRTADALAGSHAAAPDRSGRQPADAEVHVADVHAWALRLLRRRGVAVNADARRARAVFDALAGRFTRMTALAGLPVPAGTWWAEVGTVIRDGGLETYPQYAALDPAERGLALSAAHTEAVWALHVAYAGALRDRGIHDAADVLRLALAQVQARPLRRPYAAVVLHARLRAAPVCVALAAALIRS